MTDEATPGVGRVVGGESTSARLRRVERERDKAQHELAHARFEIDKLMMTTKRCDMGGLWWYPDPSGPAVYEDPCRAPVTHRYHAPGMAEGHWMYRCAVHVTWLDAPGMVVEQLR